MNEELYNRIRAELDKLEEFYKNDKIQDKIVKSDYGESNEFSRNTKSCERKDK